MINDDNSICEGLLEDVKLSEQAGLRIGNIELSLDNPVTENNRLE